MNKTINIVYCSDNFFIKYMVTSAISAIKNLEDGYKISLHLIFRDTPLKTLEMLKQFFRDSLNTTFNYHRIPHIHSGVFSAEICPEKHITDAMFDRFYIGDLIPEINKTIYLDSDTIVNGSLHELYNFDIGKNLIGAIIEPGFEYETQLYGYTAARLNRLGIETHYFNSGVLLMNLSGLKKFRFLRKCQEFYEKNKDHIIWPDQDILNGVLGAKTCFLPPKFNSEVWENESFMGKLREYFEFYGKTHPYTEQEIQEAIDNPAIIHFVGNYKPWLHPGKYFLHKEKYWKYYNLSPWATNDSKLILERLQKALKNKSGN